MVYFDINDFDELVLVLVIVDLLYLFISLWLVVDEFGWFMDDVYLLVCVVLDVYVDGLVGGKVYWLECEMVDGLVCLLFDWVGGW